jgi:hypothetical protein
MCLTVSFNSLTPPPTPLAKVVKYDTLCGFLFMGWSLHYFPFFLMSRQLFLHHYLPALYFAILLLCAVFDFLTSTLRPRWRLQIAAVLIILAIWNFSIFSPLVYGNTWTKGECEKARWLRTWDFSWYAFGDVYTVMLSSLTCFVLSDSFPNDVGIHFHIPREYPNTFSSTRSIKVSPRAHHSNPMSSPSPSPLLGASRLDVAG